MSHCWMEFEAFRGKYLSQDFHGEHGIHCVLHWGNLDWNSGAPAERAQPLVPRPVRHCPREVAELWSSSSAELPALPRLCKGTQGALSMSSDPGSQNSQTAKDPAIPTPWQALLQAQGKEEFWAQNPTARLTSPPCTINQLIHLPFSCQGWKPYTNHPWQDTQFKHFHSIFPANKAGI